MELDWKVCSRARLSRDARFDGKFFIAVLTSKVYCRPICPARTCKEENVRYYPTAAAAAEAGFRPCLRCRPECSPGTPAWSGTSNTVSRALRLIGETGVAPGGMEALAERLGVGSRHLRRLFLRHLGATPRAVAQTRRLQFAKKLIDETNLPMTQVAVASGFGCVRRFNAEISHVYHRTPTQIRRLACKTALPVENEYLFRLRYRPPYAWNRMLGFLTARATPGVESVEDGCYRRSIACGGNQGCLEVSLDAAHHSLAVRVQFPDPAWLFYIIDRVRRMFDLDADWAQIAASLGADPALAERMKADPGRRIPGCWDGFELLIRAILGQQISVAAATTMAGRLAAHLGKPLRAPAMPEGLPAGVTHLFPMAETLACADLSFIGLTRSRSETIRAAARAVCDGQVRFQGVVDADEFERRLLEVPGIGKWTSQYVAMRALGEPDAFPSGDAALLRSAQLSDTRELDRRAEAWRPWRAYAAMYIW